MNKRSHGTCLALVLCAVLVLTALAGCSAPSPDAPAIDVPPGEGAILLTGDSASVQGAGATVKDGVVTITGGGTFTVSGTLSDGRILVNAKGKAVTLRLDNADITCSYGSPIYIYKAKLATIELAEGSHNTLTDGSDYTFANELESAEKGEPNACLYSKQDLVIQGTGALTVNGNYNNGITSKDTLALLGGDITVNAQHHGINGKDSHTLSDVDLTVTCGGDALRSTNDTDPTLGWIRIADSNVTITAADDAVHAVGEITVSGGKVDILSCHEGLEGAAITLDGGEVNILSEEDGVNASGRLTGGESRDLTVSGGTVNICAGGDALDSNGTMSISGGTLTLCSTGAVDGALDAKGGLDISGGVVFAATGGTAPQAPAQPTQNTLSLDLGRTLEAGEQLTFSGEGWSYTFSLSAPAGHVVFSAPELAAGASCTVTLAGQDDALRTLTVADGLTVG